MAKKSLVFMGIDQSLTGTGVAVKDAEEYYYYLIVSKKKKGTLSPTIDYTRRLMEIKKEILTLIKKHNVDYICMEGMSFGSRGRTVFDLGGLSHLLREAFVETKTKFIIVPPKTVKKSFTGNGNADKLMMYQQCVTRGVQIPFTKKTKGVIVFDDNVVDAYALLCFLEDFHKNQIAQPMNGVEESKEVFSLNERDEAQI